MSITTKKMKTINFCFVPHSFKQRVENRIYEFSTFTTVLKTAVNIKKLNESNKGNGFQPVVLLLPSRLSPYFFLNELIFLLKILKILSMFKMLIKTKQMLS